VEERAGVVLPPEPVEREWPRMDPPNVLWFAGAYAIALGSYALLQTLPDTHKSVWILLAAIAFLLAYGAAARLLLLGASWWVPGGLAAALAVAMVPAVSIGFLRLIGVWSSDFPLTDSNGSAVAVAFVTAAAGLVAYWWTRFSFLFVIVVGATLVAAQFLAVAGSGPVTGDDRATAALIAGGALVIVGVLLDAFGRRRDAFWFHALGWFSAAAGLVFFVVEPSRDPDRGWIPMLIVGALLLIVSGPARRATWTVYGVLGYYAPLLHYTAVGLDDNRWTSAVALLAIGLSIFVLGMLLRRYGEAWGERFVRRPPPNIAASP
jgi:hypothetical protein